MKDKKVFFGAAPLGILALIFPACAILIWIIILTNMNDTFTPTVAIVLSIVTVIAFLFWFWIAFVSFMKIEINENGVKRSWCKHLFKREMAWDEICDIKVFGVGWVYFSKKPLRNMSNWSEKIHYKKGMIRVFYSEELHACILRHTDKPVINAPISDSKIRAKFNIPAEKRNETHTIENTKSND